MIQQTAIAHWSCTCSPTLLQLLVGTLLPAAIGIVFQISTACLAQSSSSKPTSTVLQSSWLEDKRTHEAAAYFICGFLHAHLLLLVKALVFDAGMSPFHQLFSNQ